MTKFFNKFKKPFSPIFPIFGAKKFFFKKNADQPRPTSYGFVTPCQNLEKTNGPIPRKRTDGQTDPIL